MPKRTILILTSLALLCGAGLGVYFTHESQSRRIQPAAPRPKTVRHASANIGSEQPKTYYGYYPQSPLYLGCTFDPRDLSQKRGTPYEYDIETVDSGALTTNFELSLVSSNEEMKKAFHFDAEIEAHFLFGSVSANFGTSSESSFSSSSVTLVVNGVSELSRRAAVIRRLNPEAAELIQTGQWEEFAARYGTRYVNMERRGAMLSLVIQISSVASESRSKIYGGFKGGAFGADAKLSFEQSMAQAQADNRLSIKAFAIGGAGFGPLGEKLSGIGAAFPATDGRIRLEDVMKSIGSTLATFSPDAGAPLGYFTASLADVGLAGSESIWTEEQSRTISDVARAYRIARARLDSYERLARHDDPRHELLPVQLLAQQNEIRKKLQSSISELGTMYNQVLRGDLKTFDFTSYSIPGDDSFLTLDGKPTLSERALATVTVTGAPAQAFMYDPIASKLIFTGSTTDEMETIAGGLYRSLQGIPSDKLVAARMTPVVINEGQFIRQVTVTKPDGTVVASAPLTRFTSVTRRITVLNASNGSGGATEVTALIDQLAALPGSPWIIVVVNVPESSLRSVLARNLDLDLIVAPPQSGAIPIGMGVKIQVTDIFGVPSELATKGVRTW